MASLAEGLGIRAVARIFEVDPNTVLAWVVEAAEHLQAFSRYFLHHVHVSQIQLDELFALRSAVKADEVYRAPETWARRAYRNLIYFHEVDKGGHFAAWEYPELFAAELRAAFRSLRPAH